jgi:hypothetical protein
MSEDGLTFLNSTSGEIAFFRGLCDARPVGIHREFNMMAVAAYIKSATGRHVSVDDLWTKFKTCYNLERLESYVSKATSLKDGVRREHTSSNFLHLAVFVNLFTE